MLIALVALAATAGPALAQPYRFVPLDVHCPATAAASACPAGLSPGQTAAQTSARGINSRGEIVGFYADNSVFMPPNAPVLRGPAPMGV